MGLELQFNIPEAILTYLIVGMIIGLIVTLIAARSRGFSFLRWLLFTIVIAIGVWFYNLAGNAILAFLRLLGI